MASRGFLAAARLSCSKCTCHYPLHLIQPDCNSSWSTWSAKWLLQFNPEKCVMTHIGHENICYYLEQDGKTWELEC